MDFWRIANSVFNKVESAIPSLFNGPKVLCSASDKAKLFDKNSSKNSNLDDSGISLPVFASRTNLKLRNISVTTKMDKKIMMNLNSSKTSGPGCIPVVVLKNYEPELSYIRSLREVVGRSRGWSLYLRMLGKGLQLKTTA